MAKYSAKFEEGATSTTAATDTWGTVQSPATVRRLKLFYVMLGITGAAADNNYDISVKNTTAAGTNTAVVPVRHDQADGVSLATAGENNTAQPTYVAASELLHFAFNQRATVQWTARPGCELVSPAVSASGFGVQTVAQTGGLAASALIMFEEQ